MGIKNTAKKIGAALIFQKLYADFKAKKENGDLDKLKQHIEEWKANAPDDLNCVLATILVGVEDGSIEDVQTEVDKAKAVYNPEDSDLMPWFESQLENITYDEEAAAEE